MEWVTLIHPLLAGLEEQAAENTWFGMDWSLLEQMWAGALGGFSLAAGRGLRSYARIDGPEPKIKQFLAAQLIPLIILPILGSILVWVTQGISGAFLTGLGALGFILMVTAPHPQVTHSDISSKASDA